MPRKQRPREAGRRDSLAASPALGNRWLGVGGPPRTSRPLLEHRRAGLDCFQLPRTRRKTSQTECSPLPPHPATFRLAVGGGLGTAAKPTAVPLCLSLKRLGLGPKGKDVPTSIKAASPRPASGGGGLWGAHRCPKTVGGGPKALHPEEGLWPFGMGGRPPPASAEPAEPGGSMSATRRGSVQKGGEAPRSTRECTGR